MLEFKVRYLIHKVMNRIGIDAEAEVYERIAAEECARMEAALHAVAVESEPSPAKINWNC